MSLVFRNKCNVVVVFKKINFIQSEEELIEQIEMEMEDDAADNDFDDGGR